MSISGILHGKQQYAKFLDLCRLVVSLLYLHFGGHESGLHRFLLSISDGVYLSFFRLT